MTVLFKQKISLTAVCLDVHAVWEIEAMASRLTAVSKSWSSAQVHIFIWIHRQSRKME